MPLPFEQTPTGTILARAPEATTQTVALYARGSSADQQEDLDRQIARLVAYTRKQDWAVTRAVAEIGCALNGHRPKVIRLLSDPKVGTIVDYPSSKTCSACGHGLEALPLDVREWDCPVAGIPSGRKVAV